jgi:GTPase SAR1 family protein
VNVIIIGPAGSGKSTLTQAFSRWLKKDGMHVCCVNLDPGAECLPHASCFDIRGIVRVDKIMAKEGLGPNGALMRAAELVEARLEEVVEAMDRACEGSEYRIIDTPGQMEVFLYRDLGPRLVSSLDGRVVAVSLIDPGLIRRRSDLVALRLTALMVELRLGVAVVEAMSKSDSFGSDYLERLEKDLAGSFRDEGLSGELAQRLEAALSPVRRRRRIIPVSATEGAGMDELYKAIGESACACGDQT